MAENNDIILDNGQPCPEGYERILLEPAECYRGCDDDHCPYLHEPLFGFSPIKK